MKRSPLRRKRPMRRKPKALASTYRRRPRDLTYMRKVKKLACIVRRWGEMHLGCPTTCDGRVEADHAGRRTFGTKADDTTVIPLCRRHHRERTNLFGTFVCWDRPRMRAWCDWAIEETQREVEGMAHG